jgi:hypothetical protein
MTRARGGPHGHIPLKGRTCMSLVFVVDAKLRPLDLVHPGAARRLLSRGRVAVWRCGGVAVWRRSLPMAEGGVAAPEIR